MAFFKTFVQPCVSKVGEPVRKTVLMFANEKVLLPLFFTMAYNTVLNEVR